MAATFSNLPTECCDWVAVVWAREETEKKPGWKVQKCVIRWARWPVSKPRIASRIPALGIHTAPKPRGGQESKGRGIAVDPRGGIVSVTENREGGAGFLGLRDYSRQRSFGMSDKIPKQKTGTHTKNLEAYMSSLGSQSPLWVSLSYCLFFLLDSEPLKQSHFNSFLFLSPTPTRDPVYCLTLNLHFTYFRYWTGLLRMEKCLAFSLPSPRARDKILTQCVLPHEFQATSGSSLNVSLLDISP